MDARHLARGGATRVSPAAYAIAGAVVGAVASLVGVYLTNEQQADLDALETRRTAYAEFIAEAQLYGRQLQEVRDAIQGDDRQQFEDATSALRRADGDLYVAVSVVAMVGSQDVLMAANDLRDALTSWDDPEDLKSMDAFREALNQAIKSSNEPAKQFLFQARLDLGAD